MYMFIRVEETFIGSVICLQKAKEGRKGETFKS